MGNIWRYSEDLSYAGYVATNATKDNTTALVAQAISLKKLSGANYAAELKADIAGQGLTPFVTGKQYLASCCVINPAGTERFFYHAAIANDTAAAPGASRMDGSLRRIWWLFTATSTSAPSPIWFRAADAAAFDIRIGAFQLEQVADGTKVGVAVIGDSTTHGLSGGGAGPGTDVPTNREWPRWAEIGLNVPFYNRAKDGDFTSQMIARWTTDMTPLASVCKYALIVGGVNDIASGTVSVATIKANIAALRGQAVTDGMIPVVGTITPGSWDAAREADRKTVNDWIKASWPTIDFAAITQDPTNPAKTRNADDPGWYGPYPDGIHYGATAKRALGKFVADWPGWSFVVPTAYQPVPTTTPSGAPITVVQPRRHVVQRWRGVVGGRGKRT